MHLGVYTLSTYLIKITHFKLGTVIWYCAQCIIKLCERPRSERQRYLTFKQFLRLMKVPFSRSFYKWKLVCVLSRSGGFLGKSALISNYCFSVRLASLNYFRECIFFLVSWECFCGVALWGHEWNLMSLFNLDIRYLARSWTFDFFFFK